MRTRKEIEDGMEKHGEFCDKIGRTAGYNDIIIELLLDIRDLLRKK